MLPILSTSGAAAKKWSRDRKIIPAAVCDLVPLGYLLLMMLGDDLSPEVTAGKVWAILNRSVN
jgi:hypothetical protein